MPGRIAAATMNAMKRRAISTFSFQRASTSTMTLTATSVAKKARRAVSATPHFLPRRGGPNGRNAGHPAEAADMPEARDEHVCLEMRRHGVVLARPLVRSGGVASAGTFLLPL